MHVRNRFVKKNIFYFSIFYKAYNIKHEKEETVFSQLNDKAKVYFAVVGKPNFYHHQNKPALGEICQISIHYLISIMVYRGSRSLVVISSFHLKSFCPPL